MGDHSKIQWTDATWNPVAGCRKVSAGCDHCYAIRDAHRLAENPNPAIAATYAGLTQVQNGRLNWTGVFRELPERLDQPLHWTKPRRVFVNSMSDLFGEGISDGFILRTLDIMHACPRHQFQVLTKRPGRMRDLVSRWNGSLPVAPNIWLGTSVEDQRAADQRIPALLSTPAAVRFLSCEPLLGPVRLPLAGCERCGALIWEDGLACPACAQPCWGNRLHWVIAGGESGPGARCYPVGWIRDLIIQCRQAGVPCFVKQLGSVWAAANGARHHKGGDPEEWPEDLRLREFPA